MEKRLGVDLSYSNGNADFAALKEAGVEFVLIRCGYGVDDPDQQDARFLENVQKAVRYGMPYGLYLYSYALTEEEAYSEARHALRLLGMVDRPAYGIWFDMEDGDGYKLKQGMPSNSQLVKFCDIFCQEMQKAGYYTGIYAALSWLNNQLDSPVLDKYDKWVAQWNDTCDYRKPYGIWQFTDKMVIGGNEFDANWAYKDYPAITGKKEEPGLTKEEVQRLVDASVDKLRIELERKNPTYNAITDVPGYWREEIRALVEQGIIAGEGPDKLGLTRSEAKGVVLAKRVVDAAINQKEMEEG